MPNGSDPIERLRAADPMPPDDVPSASLARVTATVQEQIMTDIQTTTAAGRSRRPFVFGGAIALVGALAIAVALGAGPGTRPGSVATVPSASPTVTPSQAPTDTPSEEPSIGPNTGGRRRRVVHPL